MGNIIRIDGVDKLQRRFQRLSRKIKNRRILFKRIGVRLLNTVSDNFDKEAHEGKPWRVLSSATIAGRRKGRGAGSTKILQDTGLLRSSFVMDANNSRVKVGTPVKYAPTHEFGKGKMPKRKMLPSKERALSIAIEVAENYVKEGIG